MIFVLDGRWLLGWILRGIKKTDAKAPVGTTGSET